MIKVAKPTLGGDPEFFIFRKVNNEYKIIPADKVLKGKNEKNSADNNAGKVFFDGVQAEINPNFNICREIYASDIHYCLKTVFELTQSKYPNSNIVFAPLASINVTPEDLFGCDMECFRFGCSPDSNIYSDISSKYPNGKVFMTRFSGGHIHLGMNDFRYQKIMQNPDKMINLIKALDITVGILSTAISNGKEEVVRRKYYGKAGTYRLQTHGLEYRTLSSFWLTSPILMSLIYSVARDAFSIVISNYEKRLLLNKVDIKEIRRIIDTVDGKSARKIFREVVFPIYKNWDNGDSVPLSNKYVKELVEYMIDNGFQKVFNPYNMLNYWGCKKPSLNKSFSGQYGIRTFAKDISLGFLTYDEIRNLGN